MQERIISKMKFLLHAEDAVRLASHPITSQQLHYSEENIYSHVATLSYKQDSCEEENLLKMCIQSKYWHNCV